MNRAGDDFFTRAAFARNHDCGVGASDSAHQGIDPLH
jgi:hypothetical protein